MLKFNPLVVLIFITCFSFLSACGKVEERLSHNVTGAVIKGVVANAIVSFYRISGPDAPAELLETVRSGPKGKFKTNLKDNLDVILVQATADDKTRMTCDLSQGCFSEHLQQWFLFGEKMPVADDFQLFGVLSPDDSGSTANVSPISHLTISTAFNLPGGLTAENLETAVDWVQQALRLEGDPLTTPSIDITDTEQLQEASIDSIKQSLTGASFFDLVQSEDWQDASITVNNIDLTSVMINTTQLVSDLSASFADAQASELQEFADAGATLSETDGLDIIAGPISMSVSEGQGFYFRVHAVSGQPLQYQWFRDGQPLEGATEPVFGRSTASLEDAGLYQVHVTDGNDSYFSHNARLWVNETVSTLSILESPIGQWLVSGQTLNLSVQTSPSEEVQIIWQHNGSILPQHSGNTLTIPSVTESHAGSYRAVVTDGLSLQYSDFARVFVSASTSELSILEHPQSLTLMTGQSARFSTKVLGGGFIAYQWYKDGVELAGQNSETLTLESVSQNSEGNYAVRVSNSEGSITSSSASLIVVSDTVELELLEEPQGADLYLGEQVNLRVTALGGEDFNYQWYKDGALISGATSNQLSIEANSLDVAGSYSAKVYNAVGTIQSRDAVITVSPAPSLSLSWEIPTERENGQELYPHEIHGYLLEHSNASLSVTEQAQISGADTTQYMLSNLKRGELSLRIATIDSEGLTGRFSDPISVTIQ